MGSQEKKPFNVTFLCGAGNTTHGLTNARQALSPVNCVQAPRTSDAQTSVSYFNNQYALLQ